MRQFWSKYCDKDLMLERKAPNYLYFTLLLHSQYLVLSRSLFHELKW
jgi:hypothetical protein